MKTSTVLCQMIGLFMSGVGVGEGVMEFKHGVPLYQSIGFCGGLFALGLVALSFATSRLWGR